MNSVTDLLRAVLAEDRDGIRVWLDEGDRKSGNEAMRAACETLGFKTAFLEGWLVTTGSEVARIVGTSVDSVRKMRERYGLLALQRPVIRIKSRPAVIARPYNGL